MAYIPYKKCIVRVPFYSYNDIKYIDKLDKLLSLKTFEEAIFITSPSLYSAAYVNKDETEKVILSLVKYFSRACTRCTPYGLFSGCDIVSVGDERTTMDVLPHEYYRTYSRIDMEFLCTLIRLIEKDPEIKYLIPYHINTSLYYAGKNIRYFEYKIVNNKRKYSFSEVVSSEFINTIIAATSRNSLQIQQLVQILVSNEISEAEALNFIIELIDEQILISDFEPSAVGKDLIYQLSSIYKQLNYNFDNIDLIISNLKLCDTIKIGERMGVYNEIKSLLSKFPFVLPENLLHIDCLTKVNNGNIGNIVVKEVLKGIDALNKLSIYHENEELKNFKSKFYSRFEDQEIPLTIALDPQIGIDFGVWEKTAGDVNPLIDDLPIPFSSQGSPTLSINVLTRLLIQKYEKALKDNSYSINITNKDLDELPESKEPLPSQLFTMFSVLSIDEKNKNVTIFMDNAVGGSSAKLISRFEYLDNRIKEFVNEITYNEEKSDKETIIAEILHLPEDRIGNIQMHPNNRNFGIPYLSNPNNNNNPDFEVISINDILVSVPNGSKIVLRYKKNRKEIIPVLTTAHNFSFGLPIYNFLGTLQNQNARSLHFGWGKYFSEKKFLPRVIYENIILSPAKWFFSTFDLPELKKVSFEELYVQLIKWKETNNIPDLIQIVDHDNKLYIDFNKKILVKIFLKEIKRRGVIYFQEFLYQESNNNLVKRGNDFFTNELIMCFHQNKNINA